MADDHRYEAPPETVFSLAGREHRWSYSTNAAIRLEAALGDDAVDQLRILKPPENGEPPQIGKRLTVLRALVWSGLEDDPDLTVEKIGALLRPEDTMKLSLALLECMARGLGRNPTTAETAAAVSDAGPLAEPSA